MPSEMAWIRANAVTYNALIVGLNTVHPFSFFTSAQEYVQLILMASVILWAAFLRGTRLALVPIPIMLYTIFLSGSRGTVVNALVAFVALWAVQGKSWPSWVPRLLLAGAIAIMSLLFGLTKLQQNTYDDSTQQIVNHQVGGLLSPTNDKKSTANAHVAMVGTGVIFGFTTPVGHGLGSTSLASAKLLDKRSDDMANGTEFDISDNFVALGFAGGLVYLAIVFNVLAMAVRNWRETRTMNSLAILGLLCVMIGQWQHGGLYSISAVCWLCIGALDRVEKRRTLLQRINPTSASSSITSPLSTRATVPGA
jgi:uncharacterized membrane protein YhaH (DUF805 family)